MSVNAFFLVVPSFNKIDKTHVNKDTIIWNFLSITDICAVRKRFSFGQGLLLLHDRWRFVSESVMLFSFLFEFLKNDFVVNSLLWLSDSTKTFKRLKKINTLIQWLENIVDDIFLTASKEWRRWCRDGDEDKDEDEDEGEGEEKRPRQINTNFDANMNQLLSFYDF